MIFGQPALVELTAELLLTFGISQSGWTQKYFATFLESVAGLRDRNYSKALQERHYVAVVAPLQGLSNDPQLLLLGKNYWISNKF